MKQVTKKSLGELAKIMPVMSETVQRMYVGGTYGATGDITGAYGSMNTYSIAEYESQLASGHGWEGMSKVWDMCHKKFFVYGKPYDSNHYYPNSSAYTMDEFLNGFEEFVLEYILPPGIGSVIDDMEKMKKDAIAHLQNINYNGHINVLYDTNTSGQSLRIVIRSAMTGEVLYDSNNFNDSSGAYGY